MWLLIVACSKACTEQRNPSTVGCADPHSCQLVLVCTAFGMTDDGGWASSTAAA